jgi:hypothetical protein
MSNTVSGDLRYFKYLVAQNETAKGPKERGGYKPPDDNSGPRVHLRACDGVLTKIQSSLLDHANTSSGLSGVFLAGQEVFT